MTFTLRKAALAAATFVAMSAQAFAQDILVVDRAKVYTESKAGKDMSAKLTSMQATDEAKLKSSQSSLEASYNALRPRLEGKDLAAIQADQALATQITDLQKRSQQANVSAQKTAAELQYTGIVARGEIDRRLKSIFDQIARERNASAILDVNSVLYLPNSSSADITATVIQRLDSQMTTVNVVRKTLPTQ